MDNGGNVTYIETVRSLHQTVIALRTALEESKKEILDLKTKSWPIDTIEQSLTALAIENHALKRKLLDRNSAESELITEEVTDQTKTPTTTLINPVSVDQPETTTTEKDLEKNKLIPVTSSEKSVSKPEKENLEEYFQVAKPQSSILKQTIQTKPLDLSNKTTKINIVENIPQNIVNPDVKTAETEKKVHFDKTNKTSKKEKRTPKKQPSVGINIRRHRLRASISIKAKTFDEKKVSRSLESLTVVKTPSNQVSLWKTTSFYNLTSEINCEISKKMTDNTNSGSKEKVAEETQSGSKQEKNMQNDTEQEPEVDDIELIFTTDDTKESDFKEQLVSIDAVDNQNDRNRIHLLPPDLDQSLDISDRELDDDVFDGSFDQENQENSYQVFQLKRDNSQLYNSKSDNSINQDEKSLRSYYSYQDSSFENKSLEKDESFDRFEERIRIVETDISKVGIQEVEYAGFRRNTCPNPLQYRPLLHREAITKGLNVKKSRPILAHSNAIRKESGAQTDISALPGSAWRSESSLANKAHLGENFTTLPSKYPLPGSRLKLSEKTTVEARRVLLSDIGFTSMVPELSRSADHLCPSALKPPATTYGQYLRTPELYSPAYTSQRFTWTTTTATPSEGSHSHSRYSIHPLSPPVQTRRCSAPVSPSRRSTLKSMPSRVRFANGSLPELRGDWTQMTADSGDSTDSLVEEAENYLRRSIDCILSDRRGTEFGETKRGVLRRASAPVPTSDTIPPQGWQPFLPRQPRDLKLDHWVKVITHEGKVKGGRVRYIGPIASQTDSFIGVQLAVPEGLSDGTYNTRRYFQCEPYHGIFVPFKKVIMGWRP